MAMRLKQWVIETALRRYGEFDETSCVGEWLSEWNAPAMTRAEADRAYMGMEFAVLEGDLPAMSEQSAVMVVRDLVLAYRGIDLDDRLAEDERRRWKSPVPEDVDDVSELFFDIVPALKRVVAAVGRW